MDDAKMISLAVIKRLPRYYRYLEVLMENNIKRISSKELSERMNITASQIRQDLNNFGCFGQQGYGYNVENLYCEIKNIMGMDREISMIIIGAGNIGQALVNYNNFEKRGFKIIGIFDNNPKIIGKNIKGFKVLDITTMEEFVGKNAVDIAVIAIRGSCTVEIVRKISDLDIKGIWNFSPVDIECDKDVQIENVHLTDSLMVLSYKLNN